MLNIYIDMDGVLANFAREKNAVERFESEKGFFKKLRPIKSNTNFLKELAKCENVKVFILSASPNENADNDKKEWLKKYLPEIQEKNIIIMRNGQNKADFVRTKGVNVLFDDWGKNCNDFRVKGYKAEQIKKYKTIKKLIKIYLGL